MTRKARLGIGADESGRNQSRGFNGAPGDVGRLTDALSDSGRNGLGLTGAHQSLLVSTGRRELISAAFDRMTMPITGLRDANGTSVNNRWRVIPEWEWLRQASAAQGYGWLATRRVNARLIRADRRAIPRREPAPARTHPFSRRFGSSIERSPSGVARS